MARNPNDKPAERPPQVTFADPRPGQGKPAVSETVLERISGGTSTLGAPLHEFRGWSVRQPFPARGGEADIYLVGKTSERRILKLYRHGIEPRPEVHQKIGELCRQFPDQFVRLEEFGYDGQTGRFFELQEFAPLGTLRTLADNEKLTEERIRSFLESISRILSTLHANGVLHLDLKPANILIRSLDPLMVFLTDFGIASLLKEKGQDLVTEVKGTSLYQSPESLSGVVSPKSDWWALGIIVLELLAGEHPFEGLQQQVVFYHLTTRGVPIPAAIGGRWRSLVKGLLLRDPEKRWGTEEVRRWQAGEEVPLPVEEVPGATEAPPHDRGARAEWWDKLAIPKLIAGKLFETLEEALEHFSSSPAGWETGKSQFGNGDLIKWLRNSHDMDRADKLSRILGEADSLDHALFTLISSARSDLPPAWGGRRITPEFIHGVLQKAANSGLEGIDRIFVENLFSGWFLRISAAHDVPFSEDTKAVLDLSLSLKTTPMGLLPLPKKAAILMFTIKGPLKDLSPSSTALRLIEGDSDAMKLFKVAGTRGFIDWVSSRNVISRESAVLWDLYMVCSRNWFLDRAQTIVDHLKAHERDLSTILASDSGFANGFGDFLQGNIVPEQVWEKILASLEALPWLKKFVEIYFSLEGTAGTALFLRRYRLFATLLGRDQLLRQRFLPPGLAEEIEKTRSWKSDPEMLKDFLGRMKPENLAELIQNPDQLPPKTREFPDHKALARFLTAQGITAVDWTNPPSVRKLAQFMREYGPASGTGSSSDGQSHIVEITLGLSLVLLFVTLLVGVFQIPAGIMFLVTLGVFGHGKWKESTRLAQEREQKHSLIQEIQRKTRPNS